jgi:DNA-directed RNA polymerase subunit M/transcription elongation factor TFIIS
MDSVEEWRRLKELYARMNEGELEVVANEAYDLTEIARPLLKDEIDRRGLKIPLRTERARRVMPAASVSAGFDPSKLDLAVAGTFGDLSDARKAKEFLDAAGIPSYWGPNNVENPEELKSSFEEGVELVVREEDLSRVRAGIAKLMPPEPADAGREFVFVCPKCHSPEIVFQELDAQTATFNWSCEACGHEWNDDGVEQHA